MDIAEWLRRGLEKPNKTQRGLAKHLGIDPAGVSRLLRGERQLRADELPKVRAYIGDPDDGVDPQSLPDAPPQYSGTLRDGIIPIEDTEYASIGRFDARLSAGTGSLLELQPEPIGYHLVELQWLRAVTNTAPEHLAIVMVDGDSMEPTLSDRDWVLVDTRQRNLWKHAIFAIRFGGDVLVKRVQPMMGQGVIRLHSDNERYDPDDVTEDQVGLLGRVISIVERKL